MFHQIGIELEETEVSGEPDYDRVLLLFVLIKCLDRQCQNRNWESHEVCFETCFTLRLAGILFVEEDAVPTGQLPFPCQ